MENYKNRKSCAKLGLWISLALVAVGGLFNLVALITQFRDQTFDFRLHMCIYLCMYILILLYALWGHKKPHGNMLRYVMFAFGAFILFTFFLPGTPGSAALIMADTLCRGFSAILITYISGRLDKINKNIPLMILAEGLMICASVLRVIIFPDFNAMGFLSSLSLPISWAAIGLVYAARYEEHRAAGLSEK